MLLKFKVRLKRFKVVSDLLDRKNTLKWKMLHTLFPIYTTKLVYKKGMGIPLDLKNPKTINEKLQYLKLNDYYNNQLVAKCADKYRIREYLYKKGMDELLPKLYGVYDSPDAITWDALPKQFVIKCNHGSGYNILCKNKKDFDPISSTKLLTKWLHEDYWKLYGEYHYRFIKKKIIIEEYLADDIATYKFYCFNGIPKLLYISYNGEHGEKDFYVTYYDLALNELPYKLYPHEQKHGEILKPLNYDLMIDYAKRLSSDFPFVRVDLYNVNGKIYISELTFFPTGGFMKLEPKGTDFIWGEWLDINTN